MHKGLLRAALCCAVLALAACDDNTDVEATPGGLYFGDLTGGDGVAHDAYAIVDEAGYGRMIDDSNGDYYRLSLANNGLSLSGTWERYDVAGSAPPSGNFGGELTDAGLNATLSDGGATAATLDLLFDYSYLNGSGLPQLAGNWSYAAADNSYRVSFGIGADGGFSGSDSDGCAYSGSFTLFDTRYDAYHVSYTRTCVGAMASFAGLAAYYYADSQYPAGIELLADDAGGDYLAVQLLSAAAAASVPGAAHAAVKRPAPRLLRATAATR
jgi:hypothetical protein